MIIRDAWCFRLLQKKMAQGFGSFQPGVASVPTSQVEVAVECR